MTSLRHLALSEWGFHAAPHGLAVLTMSGGALRILLVNKTFEAVTGVRAAAAVERDPWLLLGVAPDQADLAPVLRAVADATTASTVLNCRRADGSTFWAAVDIAPIQDGNRAEPGEDSHFIAAIRDVSEQKAAQARMLRMEKMDAIGQLASGITHDFNNILAANRSFANLIAEAIPPESHAHAYATRIIAACDRAADLVFQLVTLTRAKDAPRDLLDVRDIMQEIAALLPGRLPKSVKISVVDATRNAVIVANASQIAQVLLNLAVNAGDAMGKRGGELSLAAFTVTVPDEDSLPFAKGVATGAQGLICATGALKPRVPYVRISVTDTGPGISQDIAASIFEPFFTTKDRRRGSGLGLSIVSSIVEAHDGVIAVQTRPGAGAAFQVYIPAHRCTSGARLRTTAGVPTLSTARLRGNERILIVDDEVDIADALSLSFERLGYEAVNFYCPLAALEAIKRDPENWDLIITDQFMPELTGLELIRKVKFLYPHIKAILCTGHSDNATAESARGDGVDGFFNKPAAAAVLAGAARRLFDTPTARRRLSA